MTGQRENTRFKPIRKDRYFVEDERWHARANDYYHFLEKAQDKKLVLLEYGVGAVIPSIRWETSLLHWSRSIRKRRQTNYDLAKSFLQISLH